MQWLFTNKKRYSSYKGFTLIELLVVITFLLTAFGIVVGVLRPFDQYQKAQDAKRQHNLQQIKVALDAYYSDNNSYPSPGSLPFGSEWRIGNALYMKEVPQDPEYSQKQYRYHTNPVNPHWYVLYAQFGYQPTSCPLVEKCGCTATERLYCVTSGTIDINDACTTINNNTCLPL